MTLAEQLNTAQDAVLEIINRLNAIAPEDEVIQILIEHVITHPRDAFCVYPLHSTEFPDISLDHIKLLASLGFTVDVDADIATIYWVKPE